MNRKPIICAALATCVLYSSAVIALNNTDHTAHAETVSFIYGDVNQDDTIDSSDALAVLRSIVDLHTFSELQRYIADVDSDGEITAGDALDILRYSSELEMRFKTGKTDSASSQNTSSTEHHYTDTDVEEIVEVNHSNTIHWFYCLVCERLVLGGVGERTIWEPDPECDEGTLDSRFKLTNPDGTIIYESEGVIVYECIDDRPAKDLKTTTGTAVTVGGGRTYDLVISKEINTVNIDTALAGSHNESRHCYLGTVNRWVEAGWFQELLMAKRMELRVAKDPRENATARYLVEILNYRDEYSGHTWYTAEDGKDYIFAEVGYCVDKLGFNRSDFPDYDANVIHEEIHDDIYEYTIQTTKTVHQTIQID